MNINQDSVLKENTILIVIYCLSQYHLNHVNWRLSPVLLEIFYKLIDKCVSLKFKCKEIQILQDKHIKQNSLRSACFMKSSLIRDYLFSVH